jgi:hypothetical protein
MWYQNSLLLGFSSSVSHLLPRLFRHLLLAQGDPDNEVSKQAKQLPVLIAQCLTIRNVLPQLLPILEELMQSSSWHLRSLTLSFIQ